MAPDGRVPGREQLLRLLEEIERIPQQPVGPHLDEGDLIGLTQGSLGPDSEEEALEHIRSCAQCAEDALDAADVLEQADAARRRRAAAQPAHATAGRQVAALMWMAAIWVARRKATGITKLNTAIDLGTTSSSMAVAPEFEWAIDAAGDHDILRIRTINRACHLTPVHCVVYDSRTDRDWADTWVMLSVEGEDGRVYGETRLAAGRRRPRQWRAEIKGYDIFEQLSPDAVDRLRHALARASEEERPAWQAWIEREIAEKRMTAEQAAALRGPL